MLKSLLPATLVLFFAGCQHTKVMYIPVSGADVKMQAEEAESQCIKEITSAKDLENIWSNFLTGFGESFQSCMSKKGFERIEERIGH